MSGFATVSEPLEKGDTTRAISEESSFDVCFRYWEKVDFYNGWTNETVTMKG
jgi:hypothetical protein